MDTDKDLYFALGVAKGLSLALTDLLVTLEECDSIKEPVSKCNRIIKILNEDLIQILQANLYEQ